MKSVLASSILLLSTISHQASFAQTKVASNQGVKPISGFVPDAETAAKIAEAVWLPLYGDAVLRMKPYTVQLVNDGKEWFVKGTVNKPLDIKHFYVGGVPELRISKSDGKILYVNHSK